MRLLYRADGGHPIGTGHLYRFARLAHALAEFTALEAHLVTADDPVVDRIVTDPRITIHCIPRRTDTSAVKPLFSAGSILPLLDQHDFDAVVIDMLDTPSEDMEAVARRGIPLITFDDRGEGRRFATTLINVLIEEPQPERLLPRTRLVQGAPYVVLDPVFAESRRSPTPRSFGRLRRVFVAMGGADAAGLTVRVASALLQVPEVEEVEFASGPAFPHRAALDAVLSTAPWRSSVLSGLPSLISCYERCDLAIIAGGLTMFEVCCTGTPALAVCQPIDHQLELSDRLTAAGAMATVGWGLDATDAQIAEAVRALANVEVRRRMSAIGPQLVDGAGARRVAQVIYESARRIDVNNSEQDFTRQARNS